MTKETISQSQQGNAVSVSTNQKAVSKKNETNGETKKVLKKEEHDFLNYMSLIGMKEAKKKKKKEAHKSPYNDFIQLNNNKIGSLIDLVDKNPQAMKVLLFVMQNMDGYNALVCSYAVLEERFKISHATVWRHVKYLKEHGYIYAQKTGSSNVYILSPELGWKSYGSNLKYCKFPANVILSYNEQKEKDSKSIISIYYIFSNNNFHNSSSFNGMRTKKGTRIIVCLSL